MIIVRQSGIPLTVLALVVGCATVRPPGTARTAFPSRFEWYDRARTVFDRALFFKPRERGLRGLEDELAPLIVQQLRVEEKPAHFRRVDYLFDATAFLAECKDEIAHPNARDACEFGLLTVSTMAQDRLLFGDRSGIQLRYSGRALKQGLTSLLLAYLRTPA